MLSTQKQTPAEYGLTDKEVLSSRTKYGDNNLSKQLAKSFFRKYLASFSDPIIRILLIALGVNLLFIGDSIFESLGIAASVLIATLVSTLSEAGSESAFEKLQAQASLIHARVIRASGERMLPVGELVVGDIIVLTMGERVPADGIMVDGELMIDQSMLNGEPKEARKTPAFGAVSDKHDFMSKGRLFRGTVVTSGEGLMRVEEVGDSTMLGQLALEVQVETQDSPMKLRLGVLAKQISRLGYYGSLALVIAYIFNKVAIDFGLDFAAVLSHYSDLGVLLGDLMTLITLVVTVIVVAVPEGLPMMMTVVLSANMKRMLKDHVLVRKLVGIETAGSVNVLFTDKTGTLTKGRLSVSAFVDGGGNLYEKPKGLKAHMPLWRMVRSACAEGSTALLVDGTAQGGNATDRALLEFAKEHQPLERIGVLPFNSDAKFCAVQVESGVDKTFYRGAPELILTHCSTYLSPGGETKRIADVTRLQRLRQQLMQKGMRLIALAYTERPLSGTAVPKGLTLLGLVAIRDDLRPTARDSIYKLLRAGIRVTMITGDAKDTAIAIAKECGILHGDSLALTSEELSNLSDDEVKAALPRLSVVARALPLDKSRLVRISQELGLVVGMTGDGVNDAPALKAADVGFAMGSGTEVAKEASEIVIMNDDIGSIVKAVLYGRTIFKSIRKFIVFQLMTNVCAVGLSILGPFLGIDTPVTVMQMLWINMVMDTLAGLAFSGEAAREEYLLEAPKTRTEPILSRTMIGQVAMTGGFAMVMCLLFLKVPGIRPGIEGPHVMTAFFALFMFMGIFNALNARTHHVNLFTRISANKGFVYIMGFVAISSVLLIYIGGALFRTVPLAPVELLYVLALAFTVVPVDICRKLALWWRRRAKQ